MRRFAPLLALLLAACGGAPAPLGQDPPEVATFSICAFDPATGDLGVAVQSRVFAVGVVVPWVRADVGAVATQALANPAYGPDGLDLLDDGRSAEEVVEALTQADRGRMRRQLGVVDARGRAAAFTGAGTFDWAGHVVGPNFCCQGNILAGRAVVEGMAKTYESAPGSLAERLVAALAAGQAAGGDKRGRQSAALLVARRFGGYLGANDRYIDIRVDDHPTPIEELGRLLGKRRAFGRDAAVPERMADLVREPRRAAADRPSARATWLTWRKLRREGDWQAIHALAGAEYRNEHSVAELRATDAADALGAKAEAGVYLGTRRDERFARLYFAHPREQEPVMILLALEDGAWRIVP